MRKFAVQSMVLLLLDPKVMIGQGLLTIADVLCAACWITGEYASFLEGITDVDEDDEDDEREDAQQRQRARIRAIPTADLCFKLVDALTHPRVTNLPAYVQNVYLLNALKVFVHACKHAPPDEIERTVMLVDDRMGVFMQSVHVEVQERSTSFRQMLEAFASSSSPKKLLANRLVLDTLEKYIHLPQTELLFVHEGNVQRVPYKDKELVLHLAEAIHPRAIADHLAYVDGLAKATGL